jgi:hypothetical protein
MSIRDATSSAEGPGLPPRDEIGRRFAELCAEIGVRAPERVRQLFALVREMVEPRAGIWEPEPPSEPAEGFRGGFLPHEENPEGRQLTLSADAGLSLGKIFRELVASEGVKGRWWTAYYTDGEELERIAKAARVSKLKVLRGLRSFNEELVRRATGQRGNTEVSI